MEVHSMDAPRDAKSLTAPGKGSKRDRTQPLGQRGPRCVCWLLFAVFLIVFGGALQDLRRPGWLHMVM
ncbi:hypothetical protein DX877_08835 [Xylella fastidiosa subsp. fastidiosa]|nr:hypothetical protein XFEB_01379 [Xylella fastidiosa EB92.1]RUA36227.1 hypothetical protein DX877_08835 [Xylella fastidiosa subsp. fastidiosa]